MARNSQKHNEYEYLCFQNKAESLWKRLRYFIQTIQVGRISSGTDIEPLPWGRRYRSSPRFLYSGRFGHVWVRCGSYLSCWQWHPNLLHDYLGSGVWWWWKGKWYDDDSGDDDVDDYLWALRAVCQALYWHSLKSAKPVVGEPMSPKNLLISLCWWWCSDFQGYVFRNCVLLRCRIKFQTFERCFETVVCIWFRVRAHTSL